MLSLFRMISLLDTPTGPGPCMELLGDTKVNTIDIPNAMLAVYEVFEREFLVTSDLPGSVRGLVCGGWKRKFSTISDLRDKHK